jgi:hypothetical protein
LKGPAATTLDPPALVGQTDSMTASANDSPVPPSVQALWRAADISHHSIAEPALLLDAIQAGGGEGLVRHSLATAIQESTTWGLIDLVIDEVIDGRQLHALLKSLQETGYIWRADLVEWSEIFT